MIEEKNRIRRHYKEKRRALGSEQRKQQCYKVTGQALAFLSERENIRHIHVFLPIERLDEMDTSHLIGRLFEAGRTLYTSITDFDSRSMRTVLLEPQMAWKSDPKGIPVPEPLIYTEEERLIDLVFVPLLAFDLEGYRIGYGMGYYDQFLSRLPNTVMRVGLSYFPPEKCLPREAHDVRLHACVMPDEWIYFQ